MTTAQATGVDLIAAERERQVEQEGWTPMHDRLHTGDDLAKAAACYALPLSERDTRGPRHYKHGIVPRLWPWSARFWKPSPDDRVRELVKAGALIAAEIDRLRGPDTGPGYAPTAEDLAAYGAGAPGLLSADCAHDWKAANDLPGDSADDGQVRCTKCRAVSAVWE